MFLFVLYAAAYGFVGDIDFRTRATNTNSSARVCLAGISPRNKKGSPPPGEIERNGAADDVTTTTTRATTAAATMTCTTWSWRAGPPATPTKTTRAGDNGGGDDDDDAAARCSSSGVPPTIGFCKCTCHARMQFSLRWHAPLLGVLRCHGTFLGQMLTRM